METITVQLVPPVHLLEQLELALVKKYGRQHVVTGLNFLDCRSFHCHIQGSDLLVHTADYSTRILIHTVEEGLDLVR